MTQNHEGLGGEGLAHSPEGANTQPGADGVVLASDEWKGNRKQREALRKKFDGRCAYCGCELTDMHCDHLEPIIRVQTDQWGRRLPAAEQRVIRPERNIVANMMPACKACNLHKGGYSLEGWRDIIRRSAEIVRRQTSTFRAGERFGVIIVSGEPVTFYFERLATAPSPPSVGTSLKASEHKDPTT
ncbi:MAG: HNH endonuclease [Brevundimonas sp.]|uniref:HNH endonuclease n=1 Tax=Brevundimonas sp. TaxID=1871086 RepID=UPI00391B5E15